MTAGSPLLEERREFNRLRSAVIAADMGLQERELFKMAALGAAAAAALRDRGVPQPQPALPRRRESRPSGSRSSSGSATRRHGPSPAPSTPRSTRSRSWPTLPTIPQHRWRSETVALPGSRAVRACCSPAPPRRWPSGGGPACCSRWPAGPPARLSEVAAAVPGISDRMLALRLKELASAQLVEREVMPTTPVLVRYHLTTRGQERMAPCDRWSTTGCAGPRTTRRPPADPRRRGPPHGRHHAPPRAPHRPDRSNGGDVGGEVAVDQQVAQLGSAASPASSASPNARLGYTPDAHHGGTATRVRVGPRLALMHAPARRSRCARPGAGVLVWPRVGWGFRPTGAARRGARRCRRAGGSGARRWRRWRGRGSRWPRR